MATNAVPKGTYVKGPCQFNIDKLAIAGATFQTAPDGPDVTIDLFNNATDGSYLHVYKVWVFNDAQGMYVMNPLQGHGANLVGGAFPVRFDQPQPWGAIFQDSVANPFSTDTVIPTAAPAGAYFIGGTDSESNSNVWPPGPLAVIPPGFSLRVRSYISSFFQDHGIAVTFYYVVMPVGN
jgi:hypothetical protein